MATNDKKNHDGITNHKAPQRNTSIFRKGPSETKSRAFPVQQTKPAGGVRPNQGNKKDG